MEAEDYEQELLEELEQEQADDTADAQQDQLLNQTEFQNAYGSPEAEEKQNQFAFLNKAVFNTGTQVPTTFLTESELGRPLFNMRFLLDLEDIAQHYLNPLIKQLGGDPKIDNRIAKYFREKIENIASSGMSRNGFVMNLSVTKKMDTIRRRVRDPPTKSTSGGTK